MTAVARNTTTNKTRAPNVTEIVTTTTFDKTWVHFFSACIRECHFLVLFRGDNTSSSLILKEVAAIYQKKWFGRKMEAEKLRTERGRKKICDEGFLYNYHKLNAGEDKKFWRCDKINEGCKGRIHTTLDDVVISRSDNHNHGSNAAAAEVIQIKTDMKQRALDTMERPSQIINYVINGIDQAVMGQLPNKDANRKVIQRVRIKDKMAPQNPANLHELVIPEQYKNYEPFDGVQEVFLLHDSGTDDNNRILLFGRENHQQWSHQMEEIFMDGTFSLSPPLFKQVFVVLAKRGEYVFPVLYGLICNKLHATYAKLFGIIKAVWPLFNPQTISTDFEAGIINAIRDLFPNAIIRGCLFHLMKNFRVHVGAAGLMKRYNNEPAFALNARMIVALAFVPIYDLNDAFDALAKELPAELLPVLNWLEDSYIGRPFGRSGNRRAPLFPPQLWNVYDRVLNHQDRTNNFAEAAHRRLQTELDVNHPSIWNFIDGLRRVQKGRDLLYEQYVSGNAAATKRNKYIKADARILKIVQTYAERGIIEYLRGLAHNFLMK